jgi:mono/diheme cytochrome c family protein
MDFRASARALLLTGLAAGAGSGFAQEKPTPPAAPAYDVAQIARGASLAALGNCSACHTAPGGRAFAGGRALQTPFGTIHSTNITPDPATGIGQWSKTDFRRAMHDGVDAGGRDLYPAFPYDHFTLVTDEDVDALYAFVMTRDPVRATAPRNALMFPANIRPLLGVWKRLYFTPGRFVADPARGATWNRGAYLVEGLAHCGACHTPRNAAGAEKRGAALTGGDADGWHAPGLGAASPAPAPWSFDQLVIYLRSGFDRDHGVAAGPMKPVVENLASVPEADVRAIATYLTEAAASNAVTTAAASDVSTRAGAREFDVLGGGGADHAHDASPSVVTSDDAGAAIFAGACATCHFAGDALPAFKPVPLALATTINADDPRNAIRIVVEGIQPRPGESGAQMPGFAGELTEAQTVAVVDYLRRRFSDRPRWAGVGDSVRRIRNIQGASQ